MSIRRDRSTPAEQAKLVAAPSATAASAGGDALKWEDLSPTEAQAASLGVHPDALKPIRFLNQSHFETLSKANAISGELAQRLLAFQTLAEQDPSY